MMEFLDKVYGYEYFGIILFSAIGILVFAFIIVLFFGKKDEKKRKLEETQRLANASVDTFAPTNEGVALNVAPISNDIATTPVENYQQPLNVAPVVEPIEQNVAPIVNDAPTFNQYQPIDVPVAPVMPEQPVVPTPPVDVEPVIKPVEEAPLNVAPIPTEPVAPVMPEQPVVPTPPVEEAPVEEPKIDIPNFNFDELAASISKELNALEDMNKKETITEPTPVDNMNINNEAVVTPMADIVKPVVPQEQPINSPKAPTVFSSVYVNKPVESVSEPVVKEELEMPKMDLPKPAEIPNLNQEVNNTIPTTPDFEKFSGETYDIK